eukprot:jgi/Tetstr1/453301/TSEL_040293.t1
MEINRPEEQQKTVVGAALDAPRGGKTQHPKIRTAIAAEQIAGTRLPLVARPKPTAGQRPQRREEQAPHETTTTANMNINRPEEHQAAEVGATIDAPRSGRVVPPKNLANIAAKNFTYTRLPPAVRSPLRVSSRQSRQPPIDLSLDTDCATQVALLFDNPATRNRATQPPKIRTAIRAEQIASTRLPPAARPRLTDGQRPPRREEQAPRETTSTTNKNINRPEEDQAAEVGATIDAPRSGRTEPPKTPKIATAHHPAPHTADQSAMHHGQLPQELQQPPIIQLQMAHDPAAAAPQATEMDSDERLATGSRAAGDKRRSSAAPKAGSTGRSPSPHRDKRGLGGHQPLEHTPTSSTPAQTSRLAQLAAEAHRPRRPPRRTAPLQPQVDGMRMLRRQGTQPKLEARPRLSAPPSKNYGRF